MTKNVPSKLLNIFFNRRSIRKFSSKPVPEETVQRIVETGQRAPSACNLQTYSIIWVKDPEIKEKILDVCWASKQIRNVPVVFVICADFRRLRRTLDYLGADHCLKKDGGYAIKLMSFIDASLVAENMTLAAECLGLGSLYLGGALANREVISILKLPEGVLPLTLLCVGYPDEQPPTRPRLPLSTILHVNGYRDPSDEEIKMFLEHMDNALVKEGYYQKYSNQKPSYRYSNHIQSKTATKPIQKADAEILQVLKETGFF
ncbi:MAG: nitroreductase family protein [Candidatus Bathyarchaeota archaeon]|jgi:nitroreductase|nr:nitroreductase family protein [Candidatus Bathyarchaeota archaeon]